MTGDKLGEIKVAVESEGTDQAQEDMGEMQEEGGADVGGAAAKGGAIGGFIGSMLESVMGDTLEGIMNLLKTIMEFVMAISSSLGAIGIAAKMESVQSILDTISSVLEAWLLPVAKALIRLFVPFLKWMIKNMPAVHRLLNNILSAMGKAWKIFVKGWKTIFKAVSTFISLLKTFWTGVFNLVKGFVNLFLDFYKAIGSILKSVYKFITNIPGKLKSIFSNIISGLWSNMKSGINFITNLPQRIANFLKDVVFDNVKEALRWIWNKMKDGINFITKLPEKIAKFIKDKLKNLTNIGKKLKNATKFQSGGVVKSGGLAKLHDNEMVLSEEQLRRLGRMMDKSGVAVSLNTDLMKISNAEKMDPNSPRSI